MREGVVGEATLRRLAGVMVLVVCTGNTCRSPMAELLMRECLAKSLNCTHEELDERGVGVMSAGIAAAPGCPPTSEAVQVMREQGLDPHGYVGRGNFYANTAETSRPGVFVAGAATGPETIDDSIAQGQSAALAALGLLQPQRASA